MKQQKEMSVKEFFSSYAPTEDQAIKVFEQIRWKKRNTQCPYCKSNNIREGIHQKQPYRCKDCRKRFTVKTGTIMQASKISVQSWLYTMYLIKINKKGIASLQLSRELGITQKSAWYMLQKVRECYGFKTTHSGTVEIDEAYIGGKEKNKHSDKKRHGKEGAMLKAIVVGIKEREGFVQGKVVQDTSQDTLERMILQRVEPNTTIYTDEHKGYIGLDWYGYTHETVNHSAKQYVDGMAHTNGIESFWALLKRGVYGIFHSISKKHLQRYVNEFSFRLNMTKATVKQFITFTCKHGLDKIRTFQDIKKV